MLGNAVIYLISVTNDKNSLGDIITTTSKRMVYADELSVGQTEFYQAAAIGLRPELKFEIFAGDYENEKTLEYNSKTYEIKRTYKKGLDKLEITCQGVVNRAGT